MGRMPITGRNETVNPDSGRVLLYDMAGQGTTGDKGDNNMKY
jgi:hypothetical protein